MHMHTFLTKWLAATPADRAKFLEIMADATPADLAFWHAHQKQPHGKPDTGPQPFDDPTGDPGDNIFMNCKWCNDDSNWVNVPEWYRWLRCGPLGYGCMS